jgi:hypothetical protein
MTKRIVAFALGLRPGTYKRYPTYRLSIHLFIFIFMLLLVYRGKKSSILTLLPAKKIHADPCKLTFLSPVDEYHIFPLTKKRI